MTEFYVNGVKMESEDEFFRAVAAIQIALANETETIMAEFGVSFECAGKILYLRSRSRWTEIKERQLIEWDRSGKKLPVVYDGEF